MQQTLAKICESKKMKYFNIKQDIKKIGMSVAWSLSMIPAFTIGILAQNTSETCVTIPFASNSLILVNKTDASETVIGNIGVQQVQALALSASADTIFAARPGQLGILTFDNTAFNALPQPFGSGNGSLGIIDLIEVEGLSFDRADNTLFASVKVAEPGMDVLIKVNPQTGAHVPDAFGAGVDYVEISGPGVFSIIEDIAINPRDGQMYGLAREELGNDIFIRINKQDGNSEVVGATGIDILEGLGFDNKGNLFATPGFNTTPPSRFFSMDLTTGQANSIGEMVTSMDYEACDCQYVNQNPSAQDDQFETPEGEELVIDAPGVLENDSDPDNDEISIVSFDSTTVTGAQVVLNPDGSFSYTPNQGFQGLDSFTYVIEDELQDTDTATVTIAVGDTSVTNSNPLANDDLFNTEVDSTLQVDAPGVLENDSDPDGEPLEIVFHDTTSVEGGNVLLDSEGGFTYTPPDGFEGEDSFTYVVTDSTGATDTAMVTIVVNQVVVQNNPPNAEDDEYMTEQDTELNVEDSAEGILANDSDPDGDQINASEITDGITDQGGRISINGDGTFTYVPRSGFVGRDSYEYTVCDDQDPNLCDSAFVFIEVKELPVEVFNAFSPNGDGINDVWIIQGITRFPDNVVRVYNRWGNLIFEGAGYDNSSIIWNGESSEGIVFGSNDAPDGAYYYVIDLGDGSEARKGFVVLRR